MITEEQKIQKEILLAMYQDNIDQGRHHEIQRGNVTSAMLAIEAIIIGLITFDKQINLFDLPLTIMLIVLGVFGAGFTLKQYERFSLHMERARVYRGKLDELFMGGLISSLKNSADNKNNCKYPILSNLRLNYWWTGLHLSIAGTGIVLTIVCVICPQHAT